MRGLELGPKVRVSGQFIDTSFVGVCPGPLHHFSRDAERTYSDSVGTGRPLALGGRARLHESARKNSSSANFLLPSGSDLLIVKTEAVQAASALMRPRDCVGFKTDWATVLSSLLSVSPFPFFTVHSYI